MLVGQPGLRHTMIIFGQLRRAKIIASNIDLGKLMKFITDENKIQPAILALRGLSIENI